MARHPRPLLGLLAGVAAGLVASAATAAFQSQARKLLADGDSDPAAVKAPGKASAAVSGDAVAAPHRAASGQLAHYATGAVLGGIYGVLAEYRREASAGFGSAYGIATSALLDETGPPATSLGPAPQLVAHAYGATSHLVFGLALEGARALLGRRR